MFVARWFNFMFASTAPCCVALNVTFKNHDLPVFWCLVFMVFGSTQTQFFCRVLLSVFACFLKVAVFSIGDTGASIGVWK